MCFVKVGRFLTFLCFLAKRQSGTVKMIECQPVLQERIRVIRLVWGSDTVEMSVIRLVWGSDAVNASVYARKRSPQPRRVFRVPSRTFQSPLAPSDFRISQNGLRIRLLHPQKPLYTNFQQKKKFWPKKSWTIVQAFFATFQKSVYIFLNRRPLSFVIFPHLREDPPQNLAYRNRCWRKRFFYKNSKTLFIFLQFSP